MWMEKANQNHACESMPGKASLEEKWMNKSGILENISLLIPFF